MEIIVGRDSATRQLCILRDGVPSLNGKSGSVPMDVSRKHLAIEQVGNRKWIIKNLNDLNVTYVNGVSIESKTVTEEDKVELGNSRYVLMWSDLYEPEKPEEEKVDIRPLQEVWNDYNQQNIQIRKRQKNTGLLASIPMGFTMLGGLISGIAPEDIRLIAYMLTAIALSIMIYGFYRRFTDNSIEEQEEIKKRFQRKYSCPKCGHFMGFQDYEILVQGDACPYCRTKYKK